MAHIFRNKIEAYQVTCVGFFSKRQKKNEQLGGRVTAFVPTYSV